MRLGIKDPGDKTLTQTAPVPEPPGTQAAPETAAASEPRQHNCLAEPPAPPLPRLLTHMAQLRSVNVTRDKVLLWMLAVRWFFIFQLIVLALVASLSFRALPDSRVIAIALVLIQLQLEYHVARKGRRSPANIRLSTVLVVLALWNLLQLVS